MSKTRYERCPHRGSLKVIKWGRQRGHQRYKCKQCGGMFTFRRNDVSKTNRFVWCEWWILRRQTVPQIAGLSGYSERQLYRWFDEYLENYPQWRIQGARVTQKSMTFKGHPFLFGLRRVVTMRE